MRTAADSRLTRNKGSAHEQYSCGFSLGHRDSGCSGVAKKLGFVYYVVDGEKVTNWVELPLPLVSFS